MTEKEYQQQLEELRHQVEVLQKANIDLMNRNIQLGQHVDAYYDVRRRIQMLKEHDWSRNCPMRIPISD